MTLAEVQSARRIFGNFISPISLLILFYQKHDFHFPFLLFPGFTLRALRLCESIKLRRNCYDEG